MDLYLHLKVLAFRDNKIKKIKKIAPLNQWHKLHNLGPCQPYTWTLRPEAFIMTMGREQRSQSEDEVSQRGDNKRVH